MNSPDSEFSASLVVFGHEVTDRAIDPAYYWTRLGFLAPMRGLTGVLGFWTAWEVWRAALLLVMVGATFWIVRRRSTRLLATSAGLFVSLNTMVLAYLGNPYATGTAMAATFLLLATAVATLDRVGACEEHSALRPADGQQRWAPRWLPGLLAGAIVAWLVMTNPYSALLGLTLWIGVRVVALVAHRPGALRQLAIDAIAAALAGAVVFVAFLAAGLVMFPGDNWLATYRDWNARLDYASFISDPLIWTRDAALLVTVMALLVAVVALFLRPGRWTAAATVVASLNIVFALGYMRLIPGPWLEAPHYSAMLWPPALTSIVMATAALGVKMPTPRWAWLLIPPLGAVLIWAGHVGEQVTAARAGMILVISLAAFTIAGLVVRRSPRQAVAAIALITSLGVVGAGAQLLQNGRGWLGIYGQYPMNSAYIDYDAETLMQSKIAAEEFVVANTTSDDRIAIWTDPDRRTAAIAAMQLWGIYNNLTANPVLDRRETKDLERIRPTVIAMYAPDQAQIDQFAASLPPWARPQPPVCTSVPYLGIGSPDAHVCLTRLRWVG